MVVAGIILVVIQIVVTIIALIGGSNPFDGGIFETIGYFSFGIIGVILIIVGKRKKSGKDDSTQQSETKKGWQNPSQSIQGITSPPVKNQTNQRNAVSRHDTNIEKTANLIQTSKKEQLIKTPNNISKPQNTVLGMKWYYFLIYFGMIATALQLVVYGIMLLAGTIYLPYGYHPDDIYYEFPALHVVDIVYGIILLVLGLYAIFIRFQLAKFETVAPRNLIRFIIVNLLLGLYYNFVVIGLAPKLIPSLIISVLITSILGVVMITANSAYFNKRKHLFIY